MKLIIACLEVDEWARVRIEFVILNRVVFSRIYSLVASKSITLNLLEDIIENIPDETT